MMETFKIGSIVRARNGNEYKIVDSFIEKDGYTPYYYGEKVGCDVDIGSRVAITQEEIDNLGFVLVSEPQKTYKLTEEQLLSLLTDSAQLACLMEGGVDNWTWYGANTEDFIREQGVEISEDDDYGFEDVARLWINDYKEL